MIAGLTLPDYFAARFESNAARGMRAVFILVVYAVMLSAQYQAGGLLFGAGRWHALSERGAAGGRDNDGRTRCWAGCTATRMSACSRRYCSLASYAFAVPSPVRTSAVMQSLGEALPRSTRG